MNKKPKKNLSFAQKHVSTHINSKKLCFVPKKSPDALLLHHRVLWHHKDFEQYFV